MSIDIRVFTNEDHAAALKLWQASEGVGLSDADSFENIVRFLARNPGLSFVATDAGRVVATILCGHDGRRGLIHHLLVAPTHRRRGLGRTLLKRALAALGQAQIQKCHLIVFRDNAEGMAFWHGIGAEERVSLALFSMPTGSANPTC
jgi:ribosomal protein S18 acetylase RimI-like enzyme